MTLVKINEDMLVNPKQINGIIKNPNGEWYIYLAFPLRFPQDSGGDLKTVHISPQRAADVLKQLEALG
jgi:hypothetical protein